MSGEDSGPRNDGSAPPPARRRRSRERSAGADARLPYLALLAASLVAAALLLSAPTFVVAQPTIVGQRLVDADAIARASGVSGSSIFLVDSGQVERAVLDLRPIASARVAVAWPNTVTISVVERQPVAVWRSGSAAFLVCAGGVVLGEVRGEAPPLTIVDLDARRVFVGGQVDRAVVARATALRDGLKPYQPKGAAFDYSRADGLSATLELPGSPAKSARVAFGQDDDVATRLEVWRRLAAEIGGGKLKAEVVDLRIADRPFVR